MVKKAKRKRAGAKAKDLPAGRGKDVRGGDKGGGGDLNPVLQTQVQVANTAATTANITAAAAEKARSSTVAAILSNIK